MTFFTKIAEALVSTHDGVVGFEYIIILAIMAAVLFIAFSFLRTQLTAKSKDVADFIRTNGTVAMKSTK